MSIRQNSVLSSLWISYFAHATCVKVISAGVEVLHPSDNKNVRMEMCHGCGNVPGKHLHFAQCRMCLKIDMVETGKCSRKCQELPDEK